MTNDVKLEKCAQCGVLCDDVFGVGDERHCSYRCHDRRMRVLSRENMTEAERYLFGWLAQFGEAHYPQTALVKM